MHAIFVILMLAAQTMPAAAVYGHRNARFFGDTAGRETTSSGAYTAATNAVSPVTYSTGGPNPTELEASTSTQGTPFLLSAYTHVTAAANSPLTFNNDFVTPTNIISISNSSLLESGVVITGGVGTAFFLPTFRMKGVFTAAHPSAFAAMTICSGNGICTLTGLANSTSGLTADVVYTPSAGSTTQFTFGTPFNYMLFALASLYSQPTGNLAPGEFSSALTLELVGWKVVNANGDTVGGVSIDSDIFPPVPEPSTLTLTMVAALLAGVRLQRARSMR